MTGFENDQAAFRKALFVHVDAVGAAGLVFDAEQRGQILTGQHAPFFEDCRQGKDHHVPEIARTADPHLISPFRVADIYILAAQPGIDRVQRQTVEAAEFIQIRSVFPAHRY